MKDITEELYEQYQAEKAFREEKRKAEEKAREQELLDHFAGLAMHASLANEELQMALIQDFRKQSGIRVTDYIATDAYDMAKAMLKARKEVKL